jgi:hypothetical protein
LKPYRRGDIRFYLASSKEHEECAKIWGALFNTRAYELKPYIDSLLQTWIFPELAMFLAFQRNWNF